MRFLAGWRVALRIARREVGRSRRRSAVAFAMVMLPVLAVTVVDVGARTSQVSGTERLPRELGGFSAVIQDQGGGRLEQSPDGTAWAAYPSGEADQPATEATALAVLPAGSRLVPYATGDVVVRTGRGGLTATAVELDLRDPRTRGIADVTSGRAPGTPSEVAVSARLARRAPLGSTVTLDDGRRADVVGVVRRAAEPGGRAVVGLPGTLVAPQQGDGRRWLVASAGPVTWADVRALNTMGLLVVSRAVVSDPPPRSQWPAGVRSVGLGSTAVQALALVVAMALIETVLLAGPAFAVGARRSRRSLALQAAAGAGPRQLRRTVLATGVVVGVAASLTGAALGMVAVLAGRPLLARMKGGPIGPFDLRLTEVLPVVAIGAASAVIACLVPAVAASRLDVVAVLAGRRAEARPSWRSPVLGVVLAAVGAAVTFAGARRPIDGELIIALGATVTVVGATALTPWLVAVLARAAGGLPLAVRFALRDGARHRSRTAPAVAAVLATVAGTVALGIAGASDQAQSRAMYVPSARPGTGVVSITAADVDRVRDVVLGELPGARVTTLMGIPLPVYSAKTASTEEVVSTCATPTAAGTADPRSCGQPSSWSTMLGASVLVGASALEQLPLPATAELAAARKVLAAGGAVLFSDRPLPATRLTLHHVQVSMPPDGGEAGERAVGAALLPVARLTPVAGTAPANVVLSAAAAAALDITPAPVSLVVSGTPISRTAQDRVDEALQVGPVEARRSLTVERGDQSGRTTRLLVLGLTLAAAVLVLGGTLTATALALSDAEPDLATLQAVGATPRLRRTVAAAYAASIALVGAVVGAAVGFVPGLAATWPLTSNTYLPPGATDVRGELLPSHFVSVPWLLLALVVVGLPLVAAGVTALTARSSLPSVRRMA